MEPGPKRDFSDFNPFSLKESGSSPPKDRVILHCDLNNFYASVECLDKPYLKNRPVAVCGDPERRHGIVLAKNEPAKRFGIQTGEPLCVAKAKCPAILFLPAHPASYKEYSQKLRRLYRRYTDQIESFGIDECFLDVTGSLGLFGTGEQIANELRTAAKATTGLTISAGVSFNKTFSKMGSDYKKPDATTLISRNNYKELLWPLPVENMLFAGRATAENMLKRGYKVYGISRRGGDVENVVSLCADVTDEQEIAKAVDTVMAESGRIDVLINNAGFGISGAAELTESSASHAQLELNVFGMDNVTRAVLPVMRAQGGGRIVCMSSIAGIVPIPFQLWYSVSKAAVIAYVLALQNEVRPFNISVCAIMPGDIASGFTDARHKSAAGDDVYSGRIERSVTVMEHDERTGMTPEFAGNFVAKYALKKRSRPLVAMGAAYKGAAVLVKLLPRRTSNWIVGRIYAK